MTLTCLSASLNIYRWNVICFIYIRTWVIPHSTHCPPQLYKRSYRTVHTVHLSYKKGHTAQYTLSTSVIKKVIPHSTHCPPQVIQKVLPHSTHCPPQLYERSYRTVHTVHLSSTKGHTAQYTLSTSVIQKVIPHSTHCPPQVIQKVIPYSTHCPPQLYKRSFHTVHTVHLSYTKGRTTQYTLSTAVIQKVVPHSTHCPPQLYKRDRKSVV